MHWDIHIWYVRLAIHLHVVIKKSWWSALQILFRCSVWFTCLFSPSKSLLLQVEPIYSFLALLYNRHIKPLLSLFYKLRNYFFTPVFWTCLYNTWIKELLASCPVDLDIMFKLKIPKSYLSSVPLYLCSSVLVLCTSIHFFQICFPSSLTRLSKWHNLIQMFRLKTETILDLALSLSFSI